MSFWRLRQAPAETLQCISQTLYSQSCQSLGGPPPNTCGEALVAIRCVCFSRRQTPRTVTVGATKRSVEPGRISGYDTVNMLRWTDVLKLAKDGNPAPTRKVVKTESEWRQQLTDEQYHVTREAGTERDYSSEMCGLFGPGLYSCLCCDTTLLFDSNGKFRVPQIRW